MQWCKDIDINLWKKTFSIVFLNIFIYFLKLLKILMFLTPPSVLLDGIQTWFVAINSRVYFYFHCKVYDSCKRDTLPEMKVIIKVTKWITCLFVLIWISIFNYDENGNIMIKAGIHSGIHSVKVTNSTDADKKEIKLHRWFLLYHFVGSCSAN